MDYSDFITTKQPKALMWGHDPQHTPEILYPFQAAIYKWACRRGRAAVFADCGLGKTLIQLSWLREMCPDGVGLIVAPLGVTEQTIEEATKIDMVVAYAAGDVALKTGYHITNYERLHKFDPGIIDAIVLDESSILKSIAGKTRTYLIRVFGDIKYRLCCTATPAPNDITELGNHAEFLGSLKMKEMLATYFVNRAMTGAKWELKRHARKEFFKWLSTWSVYVRTPADIGYDDDRFELPPLSLRDERVKTGYKQPGNLFPGVTGGIRGRIDARRGTMDSRVERLAEIIKSDTGIWLVWCGLNDEGRKLHAALNGGSVLVEGADSGDKKMDSWRAWRDGDVRVMITKPSIFGFGMNFQFCHKMAFLGLGDSYEQYYQAIRRCWRFGQTEQVDVTVVISDCESAVAENVHKKEIAAATTAKEVIAEMGEYEKRAIQNGGINEDDHQIIHDHGSDWDSYCGDSVEWLETVGDNTWGLSVYSPPFMELYVYSSSSRDMGNSRNPDEFFAHYKYLIDELLRTTKPGRHTCVHVSQVPSIKYVDGFIGLKDFRGRVVSEYVDRGWIYHGEVVIDKDPQVQAIRTKSKGLLFATLKRDSSWLRPALADYILVFRKPGENMERIKPDDITSEDWISWARPVWYGIKETEVLNFREARAEKDEKHICPLQLGVIERCVKLWSNPGDLVCSPFMGIGSEGWVSLRLGRKFAGCELKPEYYSQALKHLTTAQAQMEFDL